MAYYILSIISILVTVILQISIVHFIQIASVIPNLTIIPIIYFTLGLPAGYKRIKNNNIFLGILLGFVAGISCGINSRLFWGDLFSWTITGFLLGLVADFANKENPAVSLLFLFLFTFLQGVLFFVPLCISSFAPSASYFFLRLLFCSFYTTILGMLILKLIKRKKRNETIF